MLHRCNLTSVKKSRSAPIRLVQPSPLPLRSSPPCPGTQEQERQYMKKSNKFIASVAALGFATAALFSGATAANAVTTVTIAYQGPLTGDDAQTGIDQYNAVKYAVKIFNAKNKGFNVKVVGVDDQGSGTESAKVAPGVASNTKIIGLVGPAYSGATINALPYYKQKNLPLISPSATRVSITDPAQGAIAFPVFHRLPPTDAVQGPALYKLAIKGVTAPKVFIVDDQSPYGAGLTTYMKPAIPAAQLAGTDSAPDTTTDWSATVGRVTTSKANVVIYNGYYAQAATIYRQLRDAGFTGVLAGGDGVLSSGILGLASKTILEGVRLTGGTVPLSDVSTALEADFKAKMGVASGTYATESIDATNIFLACIKSGVTTRAKMLSCVKSQKGKGIGGLSVAFDKNGDVAGGVMSGFEIKNGVIKYTGPVK